ncbi:MAG: hypothetical protein Hyperionvirus24_34 [Hyperionvirus sp.]|uniref:Uncharacterized protein n=1 Tax=Hyperionvirus sp. TaxID=2487770 RepID=A0A3G5ABB5_9VIRU|nr:MAG: hypothetical protein Hyperionvirus24_34 [Hyperionvirus sp.]
MVQTLCNSIFCCEKLNCLYFIVLLRNIIRTATIMGEDETFVRNVKNYFLCDKQYYSCIVFSRCWAGIYFLAVICSTTAYSLVIDGSISQDGIFYLLGLLIDYMIWFLFLLSFVNSQMQFGNMDRYVALTKIRLMNLRISLESEYEEVWKRFNKNFEKILWMSLMRILLLTIFVITLDGSLDDRRAAGALFDTESRIAPLCLFGAIVNVMIFYFGWWEKFLIGVNRREDEIMKTVEENERGEGQPAVSV